MNIKKRVLIKEEFSLRPFYDTASLMATFDTFKCQGETKVCNLEF